MPIRSNSRRLILHVINDLSLGGAELLLINTIKLLPDYRHIVVYLFAGKHLAEHFNDQNVELICLHHKGWRNLFSSRRKLKAIIKRTKPILVHSHLFDATICARLAVPRDVPLVSTLHSVYSQDAFEKNNKSIWLEKMTLKRRHKLIGVSKYALDDYLRFVPFTGEKFVLYNFLPAFFFDQTSPTPASNGLRCIAVGNLKDVKNYSYLLDLFIDLGVRHITLDIYGEGNLRRELQDKIDKYKLPVNLCGPVPTTKPLYKDYDLFIQASKYEGFGLAVIEAIASRLPVFVSDIPVFHEITNDFAHFFPLNDSQGAAKILSDLSDDKQKREKYAEDGYQYCLRTYNEHAYKNKLLEIYNQILS